MEGAYWKPVRWGRSWGADVEKRCVKVAAPVVKIGPVRRAVSVVGVVALVGSMTLVGGAANASDNPSPAGASATGSPSDALGLIIRTTPLLGVAVASSRLRSAGIDAARIMPDTYRLDFDEPVSEEQVQKLMDVARDLPGVINVETDILLSPADLGVSADPTFPNDPLFADQWYLWDLRSSDGGFSVRAPDAWPRTTGSRDVVVAVIDTGYTTHPDLDGQVIRGYDFVSDVAMANDGDAWDPDPADPGDWVTSADIASGTLPATCVVSPGERSTWHGTHVMGVISAIQNNSYGISGAAPGIRVLNVRALGKCGGRVSDIASAISWSIGETVFNPDTGTAVPVNPTPAKVVNLSLGGSAACTNFPTLQGAITRAQARGAVVVAAAGNDSGSVSKFLPANCTDTVTVAATNRGGVLASYSNFGDLPGQISISAPGGGLDGSIMSTYNTGVRGPAVPSFVAKSGTSLSAPLVSAAAALLYSSGYTQPQLVTNRLLMAVQPFPANGPQACTQNLCGAGILNLNRLVDSINLEGRRGSVRERPGVLVNGETFGLSAGMRLTPHIKLPGQTNYSEGTGTRTVQSVTDTQGSFTWQRQTGKKIYVYFRAENGERSQRIIIPAR